MARGGYGALAYALREMTPEEVCREICESPLRPHYTFTTETGVYGGIPAPGIYFGAAVNPARMESSAWMFRFYREHLDAAVLGLLQPTLGERVVVMGLGLIGLLCVQMLRAQGCRVLGTDFDERKLELARQFGAETVNLGAGEDPVEVGESWTGGEGVDGIGHHSGLQLPVASHHHRADAGIGEHLEQ